MTKRSIGSKVARINEVLGQLHDGESEEIFIGARSDGTAGAAPSCLHFLVRSLPRECARALALLTANRRRLLASRHRAFRRFLAARLLRRRLFRRLRRALTDGALTARI